MRFEWDEEKAEGFVVCLVYLSRGRYQVHLSAKGGKMDGKDL